MPFAPEDLEWRLQRTSESQERGLAVPYVTNRAIQDRLDDVVGPQNWYNDFKPWHTNGKKESQICGIAIFFEEHGGFITKWDGAEDTDIEAIKGGLSDSMKRAAVQWGIGRVLYKMDVVWVDVEKSGKSWIIKGSERAKLDAAYLNLLKRLKLTPAKPGGLQSELTAANEPETLAENERQSKADAKSPTQKQQGSKAPEVPTQGQPSPANITELPSAKQPEPEYKVKFELTFCFTKGVSALQCFHNSSFLENGGSPDKAVRSAFQSAIDGYIRASGKYQKNESAIN